LLPRELRWDVLDRLLDWHHRIIAVLRRDEHRQHDRAIFAGADALLTEIGLVDTLRTLATLHAFTRDELRAMTRFSYYFEETGHHYRDKRIGDATVRLLGSLNNLLDFTAQYFRAYRIRPEQGGGCLCMLPSLNGDREADPANIEGGARYDKGARQLNELVKAVAQSYQDYRKTVKRRLIV